MPPQPGESVIWIKVAKPTFDLAGVLLSSLGLTGILVVVALAAGHRHRSVPDHQAPADAAAGLEAASLDLEYRPPLS